MKAWPLLLLVAACAVGGSNEPQRFVIAGDDVEVTPDALRIPADTHPELAGVATGDLVAGIQGGGYVRRIVDLARDGALLELATVDVPLSEAVPDAESQLNEGKADGSTHQVSLGFAVDNRVIHSEPGLQVQLAHGSLAFTPTIDLDLSLSGARLDHFLAAVRGRLDGELSIDVTAGVAGNWSVAKKMWRDSTTFVQMVGWVPVVEVVEVVAGVGVNLETDTALSVRAGGNVSTGMRAGVEYAGGWRGIGDAQMTRQGWVSDVTTPTAIKLEPYVFAEIYVWMYGVAGPYVKATTGLSLQRTKTTDWQKSATLGVDAGAALDIPFGDEYRYDAHVLGRAWPL